MDINDNKINNLDINYKKISNLDLFKNFENSNLLNVMKCQNYIPLYNRFFSLNENNFTSINLNNDNTLYSLESKVTENIYKCKIKDNKNNIIDKLVFFKLSGILDPFKYMAGKYDLSENLFNLPKFNDNSCHKKVLDVNNSSYIDSFFSFLTSQLLNKLNFIHGLDYYGSYLGIKNNLLIDIGDDIDSYSSNAFFHENLNKYFNFINNEHLDILNFDSRKNKKAIEIGDSIDNDEIINLDNVITLNELSISDDNSKITDNNILIYDETFKSNKFSNTNSSNSDCSSRSSKTNNSSSSNYELSSDNDLSSGNSNHSLSSSSSSSVESIMISIKSFPIQIISLENCVNTLDSLFLENKISTEELSCVVVQILMILITYQKMFSFTHNDLHTNNIMYITTDKVYLYYKINGKHYKIKTFGKIFKIIDFGRAIYKYKNEMLYSDSFDIEGDASTQYNSEPYFNSNKPRIEPNYSFDLCRLGCSIYDYISEKYDDIKLIKNPIHKIIINWCMDDDGIDILYKTNGEERYPDFKLYKMITRKVHNHKPIDELKNSYFDKYIVSKKEIKKGSNIWNIDELHHL